MTHTVAPEAAVRRRAVAVACRDLCKSFGPICAVDAATLEVHEGEIMALLGPSGCGKSTFLRLVAGFERPDAGTVVLAGEPVASRARCVPPERRRVGFVFQDYALFPHLPVGANVAYGISGSRTERAARTREVLSLVGLADHASRYPDELSGGEQQRVALARALAPGPAILLMDEPFSNLDADLRVRVRSEVRDILRAVEAATIFVTHDQHEALAIADRVAVMQQGRIEQVGRPEEIYHTPATRFVADFVGRAVFLPVRVEGDRLAMELGAFALLEVPVEPGPAELMLRPEDIHLEPDPEGNAVVVGREFYGPVTLSLVRLGSGWILSAAHSSQILYPAGERVRATFRPDHLVLFRGDHRVAWLPARPRTGTDPDLPGALT